MAELCREPWSLSVDFARLDKVEHQREGAAAGNAQAETMTQVGKRNAVYWW